MNALFRAALLLIASTSFVDARVVAWWSYEDLMAKSDLVVIAEPQSATLTADVLEVAGHNSKDYQGLDTRFRIAAQLKGEPPQKDLTLLHFRYSESVGAENGAMFVRFRLQELSFRGEMKKETNPGKAPEAPSKVSFSLGKPSYLLFLKRRADGRYEPVTGQYDAVLSCREILAPWALPSSD